MNTHFHLQGFISEDSTKVHKKHDENHDMNKEYEDHNANEKYEPEERIENEHYELKKKQEDYVKHEDHEQDIIQQVRTTKTTEEDVSNVRNESENVSFENQDLKVHYQSSGETEPFHEMFG